ncbi:acyl-CoA desaturase [Christiangramia fulva]|uniref:Acyl-CoA desaturase n=1 Tax=Christiangramia fulva TaxID=2126553 RepID=A0A2R3Z9G4_9FLAO|nr:acyl-CoA desaturase [Christiangramia fulva]AVR46844.1 acyl-CoA desaturase [Christiangramia fulva]
MIAKTVIMCLLYLVPLVVINTGIVESIWLLFSLYILSGFGMAGIGMGIMHDAIHNSYSKNSRVNKYLGYTLNLIGANASVWRIQHNVLHHTFTNVEEADDDINPPFFLRFTPHTRRYGIHKFQHIYSWFFYGLSTVSWVTVKDFVRMARYRKMGFFKDQKYFSNELMKAIMWKLISFSLVLIVPIIVVPISWWIIVLAFLSMHFVTGLLITTVFQLAHIVPNSEYPLPDENGFIEGDWASHQLMTTSNFSPKSRIFSWFIGGLNYQIEHHLLPNVCHVHYRKISHIVAETAREYGLPYHNKHTFFTAIGQHFKMLRQLGQKDGLSAG